MRFYEKFARGSGHLPNHVIKPAHDFLDRRGEIPGMKPLEVDVIGLEPPKAGIQRTIFLR
jgi:hypothetical protein